MNREQARNIIIQTFENQFDKTQFIIFIRNLLKTYEDKRFVYQGNYIPDAFDPYIQSFERIGKYSSEDKEIDLLIVTLKKETSLERARTMQRNFISWYLNGSRGGQLKDAALVAFVSPDYKDWRFSLIKMDYRFEETPSEKVKVKEEFTPARRWSFLVGKNEKSHTAQTRFLPLLEDDNHKPTLTDLEKAFDVEIVTKEFFIKYRDLFITTKEELDKIIEKDANVKNEFQNKNINSVDFAKKLLGQIVFLYFLQKKGWFGVEKGKLWGTGPKDFMRSLFNKKYGDYQNFYNDILEPLFYEALRVDRGASDHYYSKFNCKIPFLNGGLFDPIVNYDWVNIDIIIPNEIFSNSHKTREGDSGDGILDIFDRYNFTVQEEEPLEKDVALDPELLGKIYEKLNAIREDNFDEYIKALSSKGEETKFNKEFGVYYTPREIVHYMCRESLLNYLYTEMNETIPREEFEKFFDYAESLKEFEKTAIEKQEKIESGEQKTTKYESKIPESIKNNASKIDDLLANIKICDPAVGSGAFPIGMLHEIVRLRMLLSIYFSSEKKPYEIKRHCIENSLYGVDIDSGAIETCKLRFWLSLVVDEEDVTKIKPLPNLDYKIVCGDSLLSVEKHLFNQEAFFELEVSKHDYFNETNPLKKEKLKSQIDSLIKKITNGHSEFDFEVYFSEVFKEKNNDAQAFHLTWVTHNSRRNENLEKSKIMGTMPVLLSNEDRKNIAQILAKRIQEKKYCVLTYNVLDDHIHLLLISSEKDISRIVGDLKGYSSYKFHRMAENQTNAKANHRVYSDGTIEKLWAEGYSVTLIEKEEHLWNTFEYIENNHLKHNLDPVITKEIKDVLTPVDRAFAPTDTPADTPTGTPADTPTDNPADTPTDNPAVNRRGASRGDWRADSRGFDIVIGNPPYIQLQKDAGKLAKRYENQNYKTFARTGDIYCLFYEKALQILKNNGHLCFITSNKWMRAGYGEKIREFFAKQNPKILVDLGPGIFESATVDTNILLLQKAPNKSQLKALTLQKSELSISEQVKSNAVLLEKLTKDAWFIGSSAEQKLKEKIESIGKPLKDWDVNIYYGIKTGLNEAFIIDSAKRQEILSHCKDDDERRRTEAIIKPILRGRDIKRYSYEWAGLWVIVIPAGWTSSLNPAVNHRVQTGDAEDLFKSVLPSLYGHLKDFKDKAQKRDDQGDYWWELRACAYYPEFEKEKVVWGNISYNSEFCFVEKGIFINAPANIITSSSTSIKYLVASMNSKIFDWQFKQVGIFLGHAYEWKKQYVEQVRIPPITSENQPIVSQIEKLVDQIIDAKKQNPQIDTTKLEKDIDRLVYKLYNLTEEEIGIVGGEG